ncbi:MAG TPA: Npt1/Npt2 family nucleotide transporter [Steroidobacteraceae bacterium]|jgi:AAA family ATP:ADP antiporter|nr:Npt1/Npt2 family nucleotide transporter [Steroidobacteraceae bacterium]
MNRTRADRLDRCLSLLAPVRRGEGYAVSVLFLQAFSLMLAYYLVRPVREALILTQGGAEFRSYAVAVQAALLLVIIPAFSAWVRRVESKRIYALVNAFFVSHLILFCAATLAGWRIGFAFFVWGSLFSVMAVTQFWVFVTDLFNVNAGERLFGLIAVGLSAGAFAGAQLASNLIDAFGAHGLMLASAASLSLATMLSLRARAAVPEPARCDARTMPARGHWLGGFAVIARSRYLVAIAALVVLLNWVTSAGDYVLTSWLVDIAARVAPGEESGYIGHFMGRYCAAVTAVGFLVQLLLVSRIIQFAGLARALLVTPLAFVAGYLAVGIVPAFMLLQAVLVLQRSFDYSLLNTTRNALMLPMEREAKYQAKTAIDTFFFRAGDLLASGSVFIGTRVFDEARTQFIWLIVVLSLTMLLVAWLVSREYARRGALAAA